jgi:hypothetical protein
MVMSEIAAITTVNNPKSLALKHLDDLQYLHWLVSRGEALMKLRGVARVALILLWGAQLALYVAAKIDFSTRYPAANYVREHGRYWAPTLVIGFVIWLVERQSPKHPS